MRVAVVRGSGANRVRIETAPEPTPGPGQVLVRMNANSLNYHDLLVARGIARTADGRVLLSDGAGEVAAVGEGVTRFKPGDRVLSTFFPLWVDGQVTREKVAELSGDRSDGVAANFVTMSAEAFTLFPDHYSFKEAATLPTAALTAWRALTESAAIKPGDWVLVQGSGGVSIFALQFAKAMGARVIATSSSDEKLKRLTAMGADAVINYRSMPQWGEAAREVTGGVGVDEVVEIGGPGTLAQSIAAARMGGHISLIGVLTGVSGEIPTQVLMGKNIILAGLTVASRTSQENMIAYIQANPIRPVIDTAFALDDLSAAFEHLEAGRHFGKIVITL
jgi:NADPH:quinone reductase-like Zn-dependent oxidoreductase